MTTGQEKNFFMRHMEDNNIQAIHGLKAKVKSLSVSQQVINNT